MTGNITTPAANRQKVYRKRRDRGEIVLPLVFDEINTVEKLIATGFLSEKQRDDRAAIIAAVQRVNDLQFERDA